MRLTVIHISVSCVAMNLHFGYNSTMTIRSTIFSNFKIATRRKFNQLRTEANALSVKNTQLKGTVTRMQRQEYRYVVNCDILSTQYPKNCLNETRIILILRLSAAEERFEHLCRRNGKDVVKMKQLARKNAELRQKIKVRNELFVIQSSIYGV